MKLKITKGRIHHDLGIGNRNTDYLQLYIGYDFNPNIEITVRRYPKNTHMQLVNGETKILIKEPNKDFTIDWWIARLSEIYNLEFSIPQVYAIHQYWKRIENYS